MTTAVVGLIGVLVGASVNGLIQWSMVRRSDRLHARTAARLVRYELGQFQELLRYALGEHHWEVGYWISPVRWRENQAILAAACSRKEWSGLETAYAGVEIVDSWHRPAPGSSKPPNVEPNPEKSGMSVILSNVEVGLLALARLADVETDAGAN